MADKQVSDKQLRKAYMDTFSTAAGDLVLKDIANRCFKSSTTAAGECKEAIFINEGKRQVLLHIEGMMSPEGIAKLDENPEEGSE